MELSTLKHLFSSLLVLIASQSFIFDVYAAAKVNYLNIEGDTLIFSSNETKAGEKTGCVYANTNQKWGVSLSTNTGQGIYSILLTATASNLDISVVTAGDCDDIQGIERPKSVILYR